MRSFELLLIAALGIAWAAPAPAQPAQGFAVERFPFAPPGAAWLGLDDLDLRGGFGVAASLTTGYASRPLAIAAADGSKLAVVRDQAFADIGLAATYDRFRLYVNFTNPLVIKGESGTVGGTTFTGPSVDVGSAPDLISDVRVGLAARLFGDPGEALRLGAGAEVYFPNGSRTDYDTDGTFRAMFRALAAGDIDLLSWAAQLGVHVRPVDDSPVPGSPRGSELIFGAAAGPRFELGDRSITIGPEVYGATALNSAFDSQATALEALLSARLEAISAPHLRFKLGAGGGLIPHFGAPEFRVVGAVEIWGREEPEKPLVTP
jgi:hypothetical protein